MVQKVSGKLPEVTQKLRLKIMYISERLVLEINEASRVDADASRVDANMLTP